MSTVSIFAIVREKESKVLVTQLNTNEINELDDNGIESLVRGWCQKKKLTFVEYTL